MSNVNTVKIAPIELLIQFGLNFDKIKKTCEFGWKWVKHKIKDEGRVSVADCANNSFTFHLSFFSWTSMFAS